MMEKMMDFVEMGMTLGELLRWRVWCNFWKW